MFKRIVCLFKGHGRERTWLNLTKGIRPRVYAYQLVDACPRCGKIRNYC